MLTNLIADKPLRFDVRFLESVRAERKQLPCWGYFLLGLTCNMNFHYIGGVTLSHYCLTLLIGLSVVLWLILFRVCYYESRIALLNSRVRITIELRH
jgi:hypothetical protein